MFLRTLTRLLRRQDVDNGAPLLYEKYLAKNTGKKALMSYLPEPLREELAGEDTIHFSNAGIARSWAKSLNQLGYSVDVISWDDREFKPKAHYDLFVGHGGVNYQRIHSLLPTNTPAIYFSTGSYWKFHNKQESLRHTNFFIRHGVNLPPDREITFSEEYANTHCNGIICLGNKLCADTYSKFDNVHNLDIGCYPVDGYKKRTLEHVAETRFNFLFLAGGGNIHKGLDLVLDQFRNLPDYHLYIVTLLDKEFETTYADVLSMPNVHNLGFLNMRSPEYNAVMQKCCFLVFPSCSEGSPGSVVESMAQGIIPIVSLESHIDVEGFGFMLPNVQPELIEKTLVKAAQLPLSRLQKMSELARKTAVGRHSPEQFEANLKKAILSILAATKIEHGDVVTSTKGAHNG